MSQWGSLRARFVKGSVTKPVITAELLSRDLPRGSESGPDIYVNSQGEVIVSGRLRDVDDHEHAPQALAWFVKHARWCVYAELLFEIDSGPRYRYAWLAYGVDTDILGDDWERVGPGLTKLRGVLDG
jgi:hypothetical protein